ncbi:MAG: sodium:solute symporter [Bacteroidota bacterium]
MSPIDWLVLGGTLAFIVLYGAWKTRRSRNIKGYLLGDNSATWATIGLSVMATQASAITFISTPGQAFESGMGFVQNYFGLPIALIIVSAVFIPIYYRLKVYTAYEYLESRFGLENRLLAAFLFLLQRGLAAGITIYAPAIILSTALGWNLSLTILLVGLLVVFYTVSGGTRAVSLTQKWQMSIILIGMFIAFALIIRGLPENVSLGDAVSVAGMMDKLEVVNFSFDPSERYTFWSGILGGLFLALSYFGTDQSQVQRYLGGKSVYESRMGLMFNALLKIPMQFFILFTGVMVFVFFQFQEHPVLFNTTAMERVYETNYADEMRQLEARHRQAHADKKQAIDEVIVQLHADNETALDAAVAELKVRDTVALGIRQEAKDLLNRSIEDKTKDYDYVFLTFILNYMPVGLVGLLLAVILSAAMSSTAGELNALAATTTVDFYKRLIKKDGSERHYLMASRLLTLGWGAIAITFALFAHLVENLIEAVNILGSIFYGTILGIFLVAFFLKKVRGRPTFIAALIAQGTIFFLFAFLAKEVAYLWYNLIGCGLVLILAWLIDLVLPRKEA